MGDSACQFRLTGETADFVGGDDDVVIGGLESDGSENFATPAPTGDINNYAVGTEEFPVVSREHRAPQVAEATQMLCSSGGRGDKCTSYRTAVSSSQMKAAASDDVTMEAGEAGLGGVRGASGKEAGPGYCGRVAQPPGTSGHVDAPPFGPPVTNEVLIFWSPPRSHWSKIIFSG